MAHVESPYYVYSDYPHLNHLFSLLSVPFCEDIQNAIKAKSYTWYASRLSTLHASEFPKGSNEEVATLSLPNETGITPKP